MRSWGRWFLKVKDVSKLRSFARVELYEKGRHGLPLRLVLQDLRR